MSGIDAVIPSRITLFGYGGGEDLYPVAGRETRSRGGYDHCRVASDIFLLGDRLVFAVNRSTTCARVSSDVCEPVTR